MRVLPENTAFLVMYSMRLLKFFPYIYGDEYAKLMKISTVSSISLSPYCEFFFGTVKVE